jgi:hypothetical protein
VEEVFYARINLLTSSLFLACCLFDTEDGGSNFLENICELGLHGVTSQMMALFIVTAVKTGIAISLFVIMIQNLGARG